MKKIFKIVALMMMSASSVFAADAVKPGQEKVKVSKEEKIGKWNFRCEEVEGKPETKGCGAGQVILAEEKTTKKKIPMFGVEITFDPKVKQPVVYFTAPLGVRLPQGISMKADGKLIGTIGFSMCDPVGCRAVSEAKGKIDETFRNSKKVEFSFIWALEPVNIPFETEGYAKVLEKIKS